MIGWLRDGLEGRTFKDTLRLYLFGLAVLAPVAVVIGMVFGSQALFHATPVLVAILVLVQYGLSYLLKGSASIDAHLDQAEGLSAPTRGLASALHLSFRAGLLTEQLHSAASTRARPMNVFIAYSATDKRKVRSLYDRLLSIGVNPWLDEENLQPGMDWSREIENAIRASDLVLVCLSQRAIRGTAYSQKEIKYALDVANERSERNTFLITVRLEECEIPYPLRDRQWINFFEDRGYARLLHSLQSRAHELGLTIDAQT